MLNDYKVVNTEHTYRIDKARASFQAANRTGAKGRTGRFGSGVAAAIAAAIAVVVLALVTVTAVPDGASANPTPPTESAGFEPMPAPSWEPNYELLAELLSGTDEVTLVTAAAADFEPMPAPSWEPNYELLAELLTGAAAH